MIGFFDPKLDLVKYGPGNTVHLGKKTYYRDVYNFTRRLKIALEQNEFTAATLRQKIYLCLQGTARQWFMNVAN